MTINEDLKRYIYETILPRYDTFDAAHNRTHVERVIAESMLLANSYGVDEAMVYTIAAYHDVGLVKDRATHHLVSAQILLNDSRLKEWFTADQLRMMAEAVEDHRASATRPPRSEYGRIVAEADRDIDFDIILLRTLQYGFAHYPTLSDEQHVARCMQHLHEKYGRQGYLKLWVPGSKNEKKLHQIWQLMDNEKDMLVRVNKVFNEVKKNFVKK